MSNNDQLFDEFSPVSLKQWAEKIERDMKGKSISDLEWKTPENITLIPYYNKENSKNYLNSNNDSKSKTDTQSNDWNINSFITVTTEKEANQIALKALAEGNNSLTFRGDNLNLPLLLEGIMIEIIAVHFITKNPVLLITDLKKLCLERSITFIDLEGSVAFDYLGNYARKGFWLSDEKTIKSDLLATFEIAREADLNTVCASNTYFEKSGATVAQQLGISLAHGTEYLNLLTPNYKPEEIARNMQFVFGIGSNYFLEIAKLRAFRMLWSKVLTAFGSDYTSTIVQASTSTLFWSNKQPKNNMLRATSSAMSAILGGCDSLTITPFDEVDENKEIFAERIATNVQLILKEESYFDKVVDPSKGSYFIEHLTEELAEKAWIFFQKIEEKGGYIEGLKSNFIQDEVYQSGEKLIDNYNSGKLTLVGVNKYSTEDKKVSMKRETEQILKDNKTLSFLHIN